MKILTPSDIAQTPVKVLLHSQPGCGKTRLATSLPFELPRWDGKVVFVPFDYKEQSLRGVLPHNRSRIIIPERDTPDPYSFMMDVLEYDWAKEGARTIVLDTVTNWAHDLLDAATANPAYKAVVIELGTRKLKMSDQPHYGIAHKLVWNAMRRINKHPLNVIACFWSDWKEPKSGEPGGLYGGPTTVNMTFSKDIAGQFDNVFYLRTEGAAVGVQHIAHTSPYGFWTAKLHGSHAVNPIPMLKLDGDPVTFWREFSRVTDPVGGIWDQGKAIAP